MIDWLASFGAGMIRSIALVLLFVGAAWCGIKVNELAARKSPGRSASIAGWTAGLLALIAMMITFGPALDALQRFSCRDARDFELCMDPPDPEYP